MVITDIFPSTVDPNNISVYIGRVIKLDDNFESNGVLYVDLVDPESTDLNKGSDTSDKATASYAVRTLYRCWENPPEIKSKAQFDGSMSFASSGDFHLRNYCFDMYTMTWIYQISSILNLIFPILPNVPPPLISIDTTPFPGQAVAVNVSVAAKEVVSESIQSVLNDVDSGSGPSLTPVITVDEVKQLYREKHSRSLRSTSNNKFNNPVFKIVDSIVNPIEDLIDCAIKPYYDFVKCISLLLELYEDSLKDISAITFPITQFSQINADGTATEPSPMDALAVKNAIKDKVGKFNNGIDDKINELKANISDSIIEIVYNPIANVYSMIDTKIQDIVNPIENKIVEMIGNFVKDPLSEITGFISMAIQPVISSLPTVIQLIVKLALKKLLQLLLGTPIKIILKVVIDPITALINTAVETIKDFLTQIIATSINTLINPVIGVMQKSLMALIPDFGVDKLIKKLEDIRDGKSPFPKILIETDPVKPYKDFDEINWSDPAELKAMLVSIISEVGHDGAPEIPLEAKPKVSEEKIYIASNGKAIGAAQKVDIPITITTGEEDPQSVTDLKEGTLDNGSEFFYKKFSLKEDFMPFFEKVHTPCSVDAVIGEPNTIFEDVEPDIWLTNGIAYIDVEDKGEKVRYVCFYDNGEETKGVREVVCADGISHRLDGENKNKVFYSTTIPHVKKNENDPPVGEDLVPVVENGVLKSVKIPETYDGLTEGGSIEVIEGRNIGDILYLDPFESDSNKRKKTFKEITDLYYRVKIDTILSVSSLAENIKSVLNNTTGSLLSRFTQTDLYNSLSDPSGKSVEFYRVLEKTEEDGSTTTEKEKVTLSSFSSNMVSFTPSIITSTTEELVIIINNPSNVTNILDGTPLEEPNGMRLEINFSVKDSKLDTNTSFSMKTLVENSETHVRTWPTEDNAVLTCIKKDIDSTSTDYYCWMTSSLSEEKIDPKTLQNPTASQDQMADMLVHTVQAVGQDEGFEANALFGAVSGKATSEFNKISDAISGVDSVLSSTLERVDSLKDIGSFIDKIAEIGDKVKNVADTAKPALEATAKAASAVMIQSCSMSQSASGKDFNFTSGTNYDLSTTTTPKAQLPYCKELGREKFLEPNCKVLVLAVGAGKQNLYVVDILT